MKIDHELGTGLTYLVHDDGTRERCVCYDIKLQKPFSETRISYWPKKKSDRMRIKRHFQKTGEVLDLNQQPQ